MNTPREQFDLKDRLIDKSIEAYVLALETINRRTIHCVEGPCVGL